LPIWRLPLRPSRPIEVSPHARPPNHAGKLLAGCHLATQQCVIRQHLREGVEWITQMRDLRVRP
jgi:hypothetical protein